MRSVYLSGIQLSPVSGSCEYVAPICLSAVGRHRLVEVSEFCPCTVDRICSENIVK
jgi:hypothetical protein